MKGQFVQNGPFVLTLVVRVQILRKGDPRDDKEKRRSDCDEKRTCIHLELLVVIVGNQKFLDSILCVHPDNTGDERLQ